MQVDVDVVHRSRAVATAAAGPAVASRPATRSYGRRRSTYERVGKPALDAVVAVVLLPFAIAAVLVVSTSAVLRGRRMRFVAEDVVGLQGRSFRAYALIDGRSGERGLVSRLPHVLNVLLGQMSLVGPLPEYPAVVDASYTRWQHRRHTVKPGLTGVPTGWRPAGSEMVQVERDLQYIDRIGPRTDLRVLLTALGHGRRAQRG